MDFQDKVFDITADFRARATAFAEAAWASAQHRATKTAGRMNDLKTALTTLQTTGRELKKVAGKHASQFIEQNSALARAAGQDMAALARSTYSQMSRPYSTKSTTTRKRASARGRQTRKA